MKNPTFLITVVGYSIAPLVESLFLAVGINPVNPPNNGQLGNFRTLTYRMATGYTCTYSTKKPSGIVEYAPNTRL